MKVRSLSSTVREVVHQSGFVVSVDPGEVVDVPDEVGASLCEQPDRWVEVAVSESSTPSQED